MADAEETKVAHSDPQASEIQATDEVSASASQPRQLVFFRVTFEAYAHSSTGRKTAITETRERVRGNLNRSRSSLFRTRMRTTAS